VSFIESPGRKALTQVVKMCIPTGLILTYRPKRLNAGSIGVYTLKIQNA